MMYEDEKKLNKNDYRSYNDFYSLFSIRVKEYPNKTAIETQSKKISYKELNQYVDCLAKRLQSNCKAEKNELLKDPLLAIYLDRGYEFIVTMLACMKIGLPYLPLDIELPLELVNEMLADSQAQWFLSSDRTLQLPELPSQCQKILYNDALISMSYGLDVKLTSDITYVMYTSGSTGKAKGVTIGPAGLTWCLAAHDEIIQSGIKIEDKVVQFSSMAFDASVIEIMMALGTGATLVIIPSDIRTMPKALTQFYQDHDITIAILTPDKLDYLKEEDFKALRVLFIVGAAFTKKLADLWLGKDASRQVINGYGLTETTICTTLAECSKDKELTIGSPIKGFTIKIRKLSLDEIADPQSSLVTINSGEKSIEWLKEDQLGKENEGEIFIIGDKGLAKGYWRKKELTAERFIKLSDNTVAYRTGDLGFFTEDKNIVFTGRLGRQIKLRGQRIDLALIEQRIDDYFKTNIAQVCVLAKKNKFDELYLVAYVVPAEKLMMQLLESEKKEESIFLNSYRARLQLTELYEHLKTALPSFAVPGLQNIFMIKALPTKGQNGAKGGIDYKAVEKIQCPEIKKFMLESRDALEKEIVKTWSMLLDIPEDRLSIEDDFFALGGDSLTYGKMIEAVNALLKEPIVLAKFSPFFRQSPTITTVRAFIDNQNKNAWIKLNNPRASQTNPLYFVHSLTGDPKEDYAPLIEKLDNLAPSRLMLGVKLRGPIGIYPTLSLIALDYVRQLLDSHELKQFQPQKEPYCLVGWSSGGGIAFEMAKYFKQMKLKYRVILLDTLYPSHILKNTLKTHALLLEELTPIFLKVFNSRAKSFKLALTESEDHTEITIKYFQQLLRTIFLTEGKNDKITDRIRQIKALYSAELRYRLPKNLPDYLHLMTTDSINKSDEYLGWSHPPLNKIAFTTSHFGLIDSDEVAEVIDRYSSPSIHWALLESYVHFVGRQKQLENLDNYAKQKDVVITQLIYGARGLGKTQIAATYIKQVISKMQYQVIACFSNDNLLLQFRQFVSEKLCLELKPNMSDKNTVESAYEILARKGPCLLVLDGILAEDSVKHFISHERPSNIHILITSHSKQWSSKHLNQISLDVFSLEECQEYILKKQPKMSMENINIIVKTLDCYPLAITQAVAYLVQHPSKTEAYIQQLQKNKVLALKPFLSLKDEHLLLGDDVPYKQTLHSVMQYSVKVIEETPHALELLQMMSMLAAAPMTKSLLLTFARNLIAKPLTNEKIHEVHQEAEMLLDQLLLLLENYLFIHVSENGSVITMHSLQQELIAAIMKDEQKERLLDKILGLGLLYKLYDSTDRKQTIFIRNNLIHLLEVVIRAEKCNRWSLNTIHLINTLAGFLNWEARDEEKIAAGLLEKSLNHLLKEIGPDQNSGKNSTQIENSLLRDSKSTIDDTLAAVTMTLVNIYRYSFEYEKAEQLYDRFQHITENSTYKDLVIFERAQFLRMKSGRQKEAEKILIDLIQSNPVEKGMYYHELALLLQNQGDWKNAAQNYSEALKAKKVQFERQHIQIGITLQHYSTSLAVLGRLEEANENIDQAIKIKIHWFEGINQSSITAMSASIDIKRRCGQYYAAYQLINEIDKLKIRLEQVSFQFDAARVLTEMSQYQLAEEYYVVVRNIKTNTDIQKANYYVYSLFYGRNLILKGFYKAAEECLLECREGIEKLYNGKIVHNLLVAYLFYGHIQVMQKKFEEAEKYFKIILLHSEKVYGSKIHTVTGLANYYMGMIYFSKNDIKTAKDYFNVAKEIQENVLKTPRHPDLSLSLRGLAEIAIIENEFETAKSLLADTLEIQKIAFGDRQHPEIAKTYEVYAKLAFAKKEFKQAVFYQEKAVTFLKSTKDHDPCETKNAENSLVTYKLNAEEKRLELENTMTIMFTTSLSSIEKNENLLQEKIDSLDETTKLYKKTL